MQTDLKGALLNKTTMKYIINRRSTKETDKEILNMNPCNL